MTDNKKAELIQHMLDIEKNMTKAIEALAFLVAMEETIKKDFADVDALDQEDRQKFFKGLLGEDVLKRIEATGEQLNEFLAAF